MQRKREKGELGDLGLCVCVCVGKNSMTASDRSVHKPPQLTIDLLTLR